MAQVNYSSFQDIAQKLEQKVEARRKIYLSLFYASWVLFFACVYIFINLAMAEKAPLDTAPTGVTLGDSARATGLAELIEYAPITIAGYAVAFFFGAGLLIPVLYRGRNHRIGFIPQHFSLKDAIFSPLAKYFGEWDFAPDGGLLLRQVHGSKILPDFDDLRAEDLLRGTSHGSLAFLAETSLVKHVQSQPLNVFRGLIGVIDISEMGAKLRAPFVGHTVLLADQNKTHDHASGFARYNRVALPSTNLEEEFEAYSTAEDEAKKILTVEILQSLRALHQVLLSAESQHTHMDDKIFWGARRFFAHLHIPLRGRSNLEKQYDATHASALDLTKANDKDAQSGFWMHSLQLECRDDKIIFTLPCAHDLFEPNSMFEPAILEEDLKLFYAILTTFEALTSQIDRALSPQVN
jgi:hypothetical protein